MVMLVRGRLALIELVNSDEPLMVDTEISSIMNRHSWARDWNDYAVREQDLDKPRFPKPGQPGKLSAHRLAAKLYGLLDDCWQPAIEPYVGKKIQIDHKNNDRLDCRCTNLRLSTKQQNSVNSKQPFNAVEANSDGSWTVWTSFEADHGWVHEEFPLKLATEEEALIVHRYVMRGWFGEFAYSA